MWYTKKLSWGQRWVSTVLVCNLASSQLKSWNGFIYLQRWYEGSLFTSRSTFVPALSKWWLRVHYVPQSGHRKTKDEWVRCALWVWHKDYLENRASADTRLSLGEWGKQGAGNSAGNSALILPHLRRLDFEEVPGRCWDSSLHTHHTASTSPVFTLSSNAHARFPEDQDEFK